MGTASRRRKPALAFILTTVFVNMLGVGLAWPILPKLVQSFKGGDVSDAAFTYGLLAAGFAVAQFAFQPLAGALSDHFGRRTVMLAALAGIAVDHMVVAMAPTLAWLAVARVIGGIFATTNATANAYIADISEPGERSRNFGLVGAAFGLGFVAGPLLGGLLGSIDLRLPFFAAGGLAAANLLFGLFALPESLDPGNRKTFSLAAASPFAALARISRFPGLGALMVALFLTSVAQRGLEAIWVLYLDHRFGWDVRDAAISLAFVGFMFIVVQGMMVGPVVRRFGEWRVVAGGFALSAVTLGAYGLATRGWMVYPLIALHILGNALAIPALTAICSTQAPENEQGLLQGTLSSINAIAIIVGPFAASMVLAAVTAAPPLFDLPGAWFIISALLFGAGTVLVARQMAGRTRITAAIRPENRNM